MKRFLRFLERRICPHKKFERECDTFTLPHTHTHKNTRLRTETTARFIVENDDDDDDDEAFFIFIIPGIIYSREQ